MSHTKRPTQHAESPVTDPDIAAYLNRVPEPLYKQFPSHRNRGHHAGEPTLRAHDRRL